MNKDKNDKKATYLPILSKQSNPCEDKRVKAYIFGENPMSGKTLLANFLNKNLKVFRLDGRKMMRGDLNFILAGLTDEYDTILIDDYDYIGTESKFKDFYKRLLREGNILFNRPLQTSGKMNFQNIFITSMVPPQFFFGVGDSEDAWDYFDNVIAVDNLDMTVEYIQQAKIPMKELFDFLKK